MESRTSQDEFSDEDSYKDLVTSNVEDSVIDESDISESTSSFQRPDNNRQSDVFKPKKRAARPLDSDSDYDNENDETPDLSDSEFTVYTSINQDEQNSRFQRPDNNRRSEVFQPKRRTARPLDSDSDDDCDETRDISDSELEGHDNVNQAEPLRIDIDSDEDENGKTATISVQNEQSTSRRRKSLTAKKSVNKEPFDIETPNLDDRTSDVPEGNLNMFDNHKNQRLSQQFQFNSEGILNSTSLHPCEPAQGKWRPSGVFQESEEIEEDNSSVEILSDNSSGIIEVSSSEQIVISPPKTPFKRPKPKAAVRQATLHSFITTVPTPRKQSSSYAEKQTERSPLEPVTINQAQNVSKNVVSKAEYEAQLNRVSSLEIDFVKLKTLADDLDCEVLPDKGRLIKDRLRVAEERFLEAQNKLNGMEVSEEVQSNDPVPGAFANIAWEDIQAGANAVLPKTFGKTAMSTYNAQKAVTMDRLQQLHGALRTCPQENDLEEDPEGLKVPLMPHQRRALAWLLFRENEKPAGGILADDMGLGKTLTMISLIIRTKELEANNSDEENNQNERYMGKHSKFDGGSLIVCPASLINQWSGEIDRRLKRGLISYNLYHGPKRESSAKELSEYDVVITTYSIVNNEIDKKSPLFRIKWRRIVLDEAHQIRNHKAQTSEACCQLLGKSRWALTGTPMHNKELDMYALLKFLRCTPFDDLQVWKRWVGDKSNSGQERLHTIISSLMLRRTKAELMEKGVLNCMPEKNWLLVKVELDKSELQVYHKVLIFSQTLFAQFLHQRAEKNQDYMDQKFTGLSNDAPNEEYFKMRQKLLKLNKLKNVSQHEILVLLLRLRQICCHPSLITAMLEEGLEDIGGDEESEELNLLDQLKKLNIDEPADDDEYKPSDETVANIDNEVKVNLREAARGHLKASDPVFAKERPSSKIKHMLKVLKKQVITKDDKAIIVSQWSSYLNLVAIHLREYSVEFDQLDGKVPVHKRMEMVNRFNDPKNPMKVLLLSLTAGGVGLNLVGANHLFLLDLHWNPQLENQAQDRIYRVGQTKPVFVYKFMAIDTIEERIKMLQDKKLAMAEGILTGTRQVVQSKLSIDDLRMIFGV